MDFLLLLTFLVGFILVISLIWQPKVKETDLGQKDDKSLYKYCWHKKNYNDAMHYYAKYLVSSKYILYFINLIKKNLKYLWKLTKFSGKAINILLRIVTYIVVLQIILRLFGVKIF